MSKYLTLWEADNSKQPSDPNELAALHQKMLEITKKMLDEGEIIDWGIFAGGGAGYSIAEGSEADALKRVMQFIPYYKFQVNPVLSINEVAQVMKSLSG